MANILQQGVVSRSDVEIVICDNAATDGMEEDVSGYKRKSLPIRYFKSNANEGPNLNILNTFCHW